MGGNGKIQELINAIGAFAEMAHTFFTAMINSGADRIEATEAMKAFVAAYWHEVTETNRRQQQKTDDQAE